jgi:hypothetical protein
LLIFSPFILRHLSNLFPRFWIRRLCARNWLQKLASAGELRGHASNIFRLKFYISLLNNTLINDDKSFEINLLKKDFVKEKPEES